MPTAARLSAEATNLRSYTMRLAWDSSKTMTLHQASSLEHYDYVFTYVPLHYLRTGTTFCS
jgi:hypothetical protein